MGELALERFATASQKLLKADACFDTGLGGPPDIAGGVQLVREASDALEQARESIDDEDAEVRAAFSEVLSLLESIPAT